MLLPDLPGLRSWFSYHLTPTEPKNHMEKVRQIFLFILLSNSVIRCGIYVHSTLKKGHQVGKYFWTSNPRRFNVYIYTAIGKMFLFFLRQIDVNSTSKCICAETIVYFSTSIQRWNLPIHNACRFINVECLLIPRRSFCTVYVDFRRWIHVD